MVGAPEQGGVVEPDVKVEGATTAVAVPSEAAIVNKIRWAIYERREGRRYAEEPEERPPRQTIGLHAAPTARTEPPRLHPTPLPELLLLHVGLNLLMMGEGLG